MKSIIFLGGMVPALLCAGLARGQSTLNAAGGSTLIGANEYEYSIGELAVVSTYESATLVVTHGVLQPLDDALAITDPTALQMQLRVYPNPASEVLHIAYTPATNNTLTLTLCDVAGRQLYARSFIAIKGTLLQQSIPMAAFAVGSYVLTARSGDGRPASFNIQKLK